MINTTYNVFSRGGVKKCVMMSAVLALFLLSLGLIRILCLSDVSVPTENEASSSLHGANGGTTADGSIDTDDAKEVFSPTASQKYYTVREHYGMIGIFPEGESTPERVLPVYVFTLPKETAEKLTAGIYCDEEMLHALIEAFTS